MANPRKHYAKGVPMDFHVIHRNVQIFKHAIQGISLKELSESHNLSILGIRLIVWEIYSILPSKPYKLSREHCDDITLTTLRRNKRALLRTLEYACQPYQMPEYHVRHQK